MNIFAQNSFKAAVFHENSEKNLQTFNFEQKLQKAFTYIEQKLLKAS